MEVKKECYRAQNNKLGVEEWNVTESAITIS